MEDLVEEWAGAGWWSLWSSGGSRSSARLWDGGGGSRLSRLPRELNWSGLLLRELNPDVHPIHRSVVDTLAWWWYPWWFQGVCWASRPPGESSSSWDESGPASPSLVECQE